jgi:hypothetical protein
MSGLYKNVTGQKWVVFAFDETDNTAKTGDAANITGNLRIDGGAANAVDDTNPTELEDGYYVFDLTQVETNGDMILIAPASSTANIQVIGVPGVVFTVPPNFRAMGIESDGDLSEVNVLTGHTVQTGDSFSRIGTAGAGLTDLGGMSTSMKGEVNAEADAAIVTYGLDHLVSAAVVGADVTDNSIVAKLAASGATADWDTFVNTTDSLQAIRDKQTDIETDTQDLQTQVGTAGAGLTDLGGMSTSMKGEVNAQVLDVLNVDTFAQPSQEAPAATQTIVTMVGYLYKAWRNKSDQDATTYQLYNDDAVTVDHKSPVSDDGTTITRGEVTTGP